MGKTIIVSPSKFKKAKISFPSIVGRRIQDGWVVDEERRRNNSFPSI